VQLKISIKNLPKHLVGKTLMQISDIHVGKRFDYQYIIKSFEKAKQFNPYIVINTGDFIISDIDEVQHHFKKKY